MERDRKRTHDDEDEELSPEELARLEEDLKRRKIDKGMYERYVLHDMEKLKSLGLEANVIMDFVTRAGREFLAVEILLHLDYHSITQLCQASQLIKMYCHEALGEKFWRAVLTGDLILGLENIDTGGAVERALSIFMRTHSSKASYKEFVHRDGINSVIQNLIRHRGDRVIAAVYCEAAHLTKTNSMKVKEEEGSTAHGDSKSLGIGGAKRHKRTSYRRKLYNKKDPPNMGLSKTINANGKDLEFFIWNLKQMTSGTRRSLESFTVSGDPRVLKTTPMLTLLELDDHVHEIPLGILVGLKNNPIPIYDSGVMLLDNFDDKVLNVELGGEGHSYESARVLTLDPHTFTTVRIMKRTIMTDFMWAKQAGPSMGFYMYSMNELVIHKLDMRFVGDYLLNYKKRKEALLFPESYLGDLYRSTLKDLVTDPSDLEGMTNLKLSEKGKEVFRIEPGSSKSPIHTGNVIAIQGKAGVQLFDEATSSPICSHLHDKDALIKWVVKLRGETDSACPTCTKNKTKN